MFFTTMRNPHKQGNRPTSACVMARCIATAPKTAEERLYTLARGWLAYPVTPGAHIAIAEIIILVLYNRSSAVDYYSSTDPQVGKPTWGYDYTTALRRLPSPSDCHHHRPQKTAPHRHAPMARCIAIAKNRRRAVIYVSKGNSSCRRSCKRRLCC